MSTPPGFVFPVIITPNGLQPQDPNVIQSQLIANATALSPGYTANLPGSLIEDISSTDVAAIVLIDQAKVEAVNSLTPYAANVFTLNQLGQMYGVPLGQVTNTSVLVVFAGRVGYVITNGTIVGDGQNSYQVQIGGVITSTGFSSPITAIAITAGSFGVPAGTVNQIISSVPSSIGLTVTNPTAGNPGGAAETYYAYRTRVLQACLAACVGTPRYIKTIIGIVLGSQANLISVQQSGIGLRIVVGGSADIYNIANAIFMSVADVSTLQGSAVSGTRNVNTSLYDYPDTYNVLSVAAPIQTVTISGTWNTSQANFTNGGSFPQLTQQPIANYINGLGIGQPINLLELNAIFQTAVQPFLNPTLLTRLVWGVFINGVLVNPVAGTQAVFGDPEGYYNIATTGISIQQG